MTGVQRAGPEHPDEAHGHRVAGLRPGPSVFRLFVLLFSSPGRPGTILHTLHPNTSLTPFRRPSLTVLLSLRFFISVRTQTFYAINEGRGLFGVPIA